MKQKTAVCFIVGLILIIAPCVNAQELSNKQYLSKIGVLDSLYSTILNESRDIYIQLPAGYSPEGNRKYPVVYLLDGEVFLPALSTIHDFYSGGFIPEMVLVGLSNSKNRLRDLTTSSVETMYGMPFTQENGKAEDFYHFIEKELIPFIEKKYKVSNYRTLIGHSYGGLFTMYTLLYHSQLFNNYLAIDPSLDWDDQKLLKEAQGLLSDKNYNHKSLYISLSGQLHMQNSKITIENVMLDSSDNTLFSRSNIAFSDVIRQNSANGLTFTWKFYPNDLHGTIPLPSIMDGLITLFEWFQMEDTDRINSFDTSTEELLGIINNRAAKLHDHFGYSEAPYPEELLNMSGYMNMDMQQIEKAKMYFELAIKFYPESANAYDSMADFYESQNDKKNALKFVRKAYEINPSVYYKERIVALSGNK